MRDDSGSDAGVRNDPPSLREATGNKRPDPRENPVDFLRWLLQTDQETVAFVREVLSSVLLVALIGVLLFAVSGVWPPMVAVESPSMTPHLQPGDLVFVVNEHRYVPDSAYDDTGVVPYDTGKEVDYRKFGSYGDVIVYDSPNSDGPPVIHRARFWVSAGENWYDRANKSYVNAEECGATPDEGLPNCPAPHAGFITKGDANHYYDQNGGISPPVRPDWVEATAEARVPYLGCVRLWFMGNPPPACRL
jgi:signal peptidase